LNSAIRIGVLTEENLALAFMKFIQARSIHPDYHLLTAENTAKLQRRDSKFSLDSERTRRPKKNKII
jgi:glycerophosphoryl diester phosphodiesterase